MVGAIIGKGGAKINEIRHLSGSVIKINEPQDNSNERLVTITGTQECNQMALYMLYSRLGKPLVIPANETNSNICDRKREASNLDSPMVPCVRRAIDDKCLAGVIVGTNRCTPATSFCLSDTRLIIFY